MMFSSFMFNVHTYCCQMGTPLQNNGRSIGAPAENYKYKLLLDQSEMYSYILSKFPENTIEPKMIVWVLLEYIRYLHSLDITRRILNTYNVPSVLDHWQSTEYPCNITYTSW